MSIAVTDTTKNSGGGAVAGSVTSFYLSANSSLGAGDVLLGGRSTGLISPAAPRSVSTSLTIPPGIAAGSYYIIAKADDADAVPETDETDNIRAVLIHISPDLIVSVLTVPASAVRRLDDLRFRHDEEPGPGNRGGDRDAALPLDQ